MTSIKTAPAPVLTREMFLQTVLQSRPAHAVFDCDGTLWAGDAGYGFMVWSLNRGLVSRNASDWLDSRYRGYRAGSVSELAMCGEMVQVYTGLLEEEIRQAAAEYFAEEIRPQIFPEMLSLIQKLKAAGTEVWAVSSTNNWVIEEGVRDFGISPERVLAARVDVRDGIISHDLVDVPTDEGKAESLKRVHLSQPDAVFGNSVHDVAMLELARNAFPVNPTPALLQIAGQRGWPVYYPEALLDHK